MACRDFGAHFLLFTVGSGGSVNALSSLIFRSDCSEDTRTECAPKQLSIWAGDPPDNTWEITDSLYSTNQCEVSFINHIIFVKHWRVHYV